MNRDEIGDMYDHDASTKDADVLIKASKLSALKKENAELRETLARELFQYGQRFTKAAEQMQQLQSKLDVAVKALENSVKAWDKHVKYLDEHLHKAEHYFEYSHYKSGMMLSRNHFELIKSALLIGAREALDAIGKGEG